MRRFTTPNFTLSANAVLILFLSCLLFASGLVLASATQGGFKQSVHLATSHQPETFTELYFDSPSSLPSYAVAGKQQTVHFHITNHEARPMTYVYATEVTIHGVTTSSSHLLVLGSGAGADLPLAFTIPTPNTTATVAISLMQQAQRISFRATS